MIKYPEMREELIFNIRTLADVVYQQRVWINHERPKEKYENEFSYAVHFILDDMALDIYPRQAIGAILSDETELLILQEVVTAISEVLKDVGHNASDEEYICSRQWPEVVSAAKRAYRMLTGGKEPDGLFQAIQQREPY
jgi:hypothetical protein